MIGNSVRAETAVRPVPRGDSVEGGEQERGRNDGVGGTERAEGDAVND
jgi:hypothetical protein